MKLSVKIILALLFICFLCFSCVREEQDQLSHEDLDDRFYIEKIYVNTNFEVVPF
ncbi:hypothetical protein LNTAR_02347 [Lentisphaera araneosa HTCC2155]|jgi:hypothetical protein|uniref:Uncharacterized protein n=1 Tax=Lentisphaera araneosa HTCC2155 TaxID=313628 RepID=A6DP79_9BACT|nr:hypothetical protein LNTAR_02347 [Lentisphaera araneosa HTCC2155]